MESHHPKHKVGGIEITKSILYFVLYSLLEIIDVGAAMYGYLKWSTAVVVEKAPKCKKVPAKHQGWWKYGVAVRVQCIKGCAGLDVHRNRRTRDPAT